MTRFALTAALLLSLAGCARADGEKPAAAAGAAAAVAEGPAAPIEDRPGRPTRPQPNFAVGDWPQFLGPQGTGVSNETGLADSWPAAGPPVVWSKEIGVGYSAPSVLGDRLVVHHRDRNREIVECLDAATGTSAWRHAYSTDFTDPYGYNGGPRCTPLLADRRCYTFGAAGTLCCVELATGKEVWRRETQKDFSVPGGFFGVGCSPILYGDLLIVLVGGQPDAAVVAFDKDTGKTLWHAGGRPTWDGARTSQNDQYAWTGDEMLVSYSSPLVATIGDEHHVLCLLRQGLVSFDPWTGRERFHYWFRSSLNDSVNAARPVVAGNRVLVTAAYLTGAALLGATSNGYEELWRDRSNLECHWSTPIVVEDYVYGFSGRHENEGTLRCLELATGEIAWVADGSEAVRDSLEPDRLGRGFRDKRTGAAAPWPFFGRGSKILVDGKFIILGERGTLYLADATHTGYRERSRAAAPGISFPAWAAPVLSRGRLYLRDEDTLVCLDVTSGAREDE